MITHCPECGRRYAAGLLWGGFDYPLSRASAVYRRAFEHIRARYPYWNRSGGADHLWTFPHDEGACLAPSEINTSILISHWGRTMLRPNNHTSTSHGQGWHVPPYHRRMYGAEQW